VTDPAVLMTAPPTQPGDIVDAHMHLFTVAVMEELVERFPEAARFAQAIKDRRFGRRGERWELPDLPPEEMASWYVERLRDAGVAKGLVVATVPDSNYFREFIVAAKGHIHALSSIDPTAPDAVEQVEKDMADGFKGVKLYPVSRNFCVSDPKARPFFDRAAELGAHFIIHYGVSVDTRSDMRFADPIDLSPVARDHPDTMFVVAHFGAGWLDSILRVSYQCKNVCVDTSGTNNWMDHYIPRLTLPEVFERALMALTPERVLFGTDAGTTAPYRKWLMFQQRRVLQELGLSETDQDLIMRGNAVRIFGLDG
jgi:predicted TIM-barrel fold metal-dependent hydrolase